MSKVKWKEQLHFFVPEADDQPFRYAMYNVIMFVFLGLCVAALYAVYHLFEPFLHPMAWACLVGTVIFPLKSTVTTATKSWLSELKSTNTPLVVGWLLLPFRLLDRLADLLWSVLSRKEFLVLLSVYPAIMLLGRLNAFSVIIVMITSCLTWLDGFIDFFASKWIILAWVPYTLTYLMWLWLQGPEPTNTTLSRFLALPAWLVTLCIGASLFGPFQVFFFVGIIIVIGLTLGGAIGSNPPSPSSADTSTSDPTPPHDPRGDLSTQESVSNGAEGMSLADTYLSYLSIACVLLFMAKHWWLLYVLTVPLVWMSVKQLGAYFGLWSKLCGLSKQFYSKFESRFKHVVDTAIPEPVRNLAKTLFTGDQVVTEVLHSSMDVISSVIVMILVLFAAVILGFFVVFQIHGETMKLVDLGRDVMDKSLSSNSTISRWAMDAGHQALGDQDLDSVVDQGYQYARGWLSTQVRSLVDEPERADLLESQVKLLLDRIYEMWLLRQKQTEDYLGAAPGVHGTWAHLSDGLDFSALHTELVAIAKENVEALKSILQQVWLIVQSNMSLVTSLLLGLLSVVAGFGFELLNIIVSGLVFLTALYYLLATSKREWKPIEWFSQMTPTKAGQESGAASPVANAVEGSIKGVFLLTGKKAIFYALYTWFVHTLFDVQVTFIPSVFACLLAAIPLTSPYWVAVPGILELWLVRSQPLLAGVFFVAHLAPTLVVDAEFVKELRGSHPYLTGLAIVGGMYWIGLAGAIIGPLLLCLCLVMFHLYRSMLASS